MRVANRKCIWRLSLKSMRASAMRNVITILAIALTTVLFTTLFIIAGSINYAFEQSNFRQVGGYAHGSFKYLTKEQVEELRDDPLIMEYGVRRYVGMPQEAPFHKSHVEISWCDANAAKWMYLEPIEGRRPKEGTNEAATDTRVLSLLGVEPKMGAEFSITLNLNGTEITENYVLSGWWEYDEAITASHVLIPESRAETILQKMEPDPDDEVTGMYNMDVMFESTAHIEMDMWEVLEHHNYQSEDRFSDEDYISYGVNWGYTSSQLLGSMDPVVVLAIGGILLLIICTGYLIIYNVFQISVANDIRFYGLLKTIGTTGKQIRRIVLQQAFLLSGIGIPIGLLLGAGVGAVLTPVVLKDLNGVVEDAISFSPVFFVVSAAFALFTVMISCKKPGKMAAKVSPVEAVHYTEGTRVKQKIRKGTKATSLHRMAWANLGRNRSKTVVTILSLALSVVLLNLTVMFTEGFDSDKYISKSICTDFIVADAKYFQVGGTIWYQDMELSEEVIAQLEQAAELTGGRVYGRTSSVQEFITENYYREKYGQWSTSEEMDRSLVYTERDEEGLLSEDAQLFGMESFALDKLTVIEGDISKIYEPEGNYIAAVYLMDDYGNPEMDSNWAKVGDKITLRYVDEYEYYDVKTGEILELDEIGEERAYGCRASVYEDVEYEVVALVSVPHAISYRYYGMDEFVLNAKTFIRDTKTDSVMLYACDTTEEDNAAMEKFLADYTAQVMPQLDYESRESYMEEFEEFRYTYLLLGSALSFIIGLVGVLNFLNAVLTGIWARKREFAVMQSIGMTGKQLKRMLIWEGVYYAMGAIGLAFIICVFGAPVERTAFESMFWFYSYHFTAIPIAIVTPAFVLLGILLPLIVYQVVSKHTIVERLRETD